MGDVKKQMRYVQVGQPLSYHFFHYNVISSVDDINPGGHFAVRLHLQVVSRYYSDVGDALGTFHLDGLWFNCVKCELVQGQLSENFTCHQKLDWALVIHLIKDLRVNCPETWRVDLAVEDEC